MYTLNRHEDAKMIHVAVISYLFGYIIIFIAVPTLSFIYVSKPNISEAIPWTFIIFLIMDYLLFILIFVLSAIGLNQSLRTIHNSDTITAYSSLPFVWKSAFMTSWITSTLMMIGASVLSCKNVNKLPLN